MKYINGLTKRKLPQWTGKEWYHQRFDGSPYFMHMIGESEILWHDDRKQGGDFTVHYCFYDNGKADWYIEMDDIKKVYTAVIKNGAGNLAYSRRLMALWDSDEAAFYALCREIGVANLSTLSEKELVALHDKFVDVVLARDSSSSLIDGFALGTDELIAEKIKILYEKSTLKDSLRFNELFSILTAPVHLSFINEAEVSLLKIALEVRKNPEKRGALVKKHQKDFFWIHNNYVDAYVLDILYFNQELDKLLSLSTDVVKLMNDIEQTPMVHKAKKKEYESLVAQDKELSFLLRVSEDFTKWQDDRKKATLWTMHYGSLLLSEISKRTGLSLELLKYMSPREVSTIFQDKPNELQLQKRKKNGVFYWDKEGHEVLVGKDADEVRDAILKVKDFSDIDDFRGLTACLGKAVGTVRVVKSAKDMGKVGEGEILVAVMTRPDYIPAMKKAAAIVTDEGCVTSHAAIVARELGKPCIIGTKIATKVLKDGDKVEVNANHGWVKILKK